MKLENIDRFYLIDSDRNLLKTVVNALDKEGERPYITLSTNSRQDMRIPNETALAIRNLLRKHLEIIEKEIESL